MLSSQIVLTPNTLAINNANNPGAAPVVITASGFSLRRIFIKSRIYGGRGEGIARSKIGNHQGSLDIGGSYNFGSISVMVYRQSFYDVGALANLANIKDGLNGINFTNNAYKKKDKFWDWNKVLFEFFFTKDQAGYWLPSTCVKAYSKHCK